MLTNINELTLMRSKIYKQPTLIIETLLKALMSYISKSNVALVG